jgi:hypothetical protein
MDKRIVIGSTVIIKSGNTNTVAIVEELEKDYILLHRTFENSRITIDNPDTKFKLTWVNNHVRDQINKGVWWSLTETEIKTIIEEYINFYDLSKMKEYLTSYIDKVT